MGTYVTGVESFLLERTQATGVESFLFEGTQTTGANVPLWPENVATCQYFYIKKV